MNKTITQSTIQKPLYISMGVGIFFVGCALNGQLHPVNVFMQATGFFFSVFCFWDWYTDRKIRSDWHRAEVAAFSAQHTPRQAQTEIPPAPPIADTNDSIFRIPLNSTAKTQYRIERANIPPKEFLTYIYDAKELRGEDWLEKNTEWKKAGDYLRTLSDFGWLLGRDGERRKTGQLKGNVYDAIEYFYG